MIALRPSAGAEACAAAPVTMTRKFSNPRLLTTSCIAVGSDKTAMSAWAPRPTKARVPAESSSSPTTAASDAGLLVHTAGIPCVLFGPGDLEQAAHRPDEWIDLSEVETAQRVFECLLLGPRPS
ncbi:MAG: M20 family metallopeptidase [Chloroflexi bacterium]|nr:MAG: M20 family metallopeptidase [Chloroflexota bacterium]